MDKWVSYKLKIIDFFLNHYIGKVLSLIVLTTIILIPLYIGLNSNHWNNESSFPNSTFSLTADSLITTATITLITFTNFAPSGSSGTANLARKIYWKSYDLTSSVKLKHSILWFLTGAFLTPPWIISITTFTTLGEVLLLSYKIKYFLIYSLFFLTIMMLFTAMVRFYIFYTYISKNVSKYLINKINKANKKYVYSNVTDLLSLFRITSNFELVLTILRNANKDSKIEKIIKNKNEKIKDFLEINHEFNIKEILHPTWDFNKKDNAMKILILFSTNIILNKNIYDSFIKKGMIDTYLSEILHKNNFELLKSSIENFEDIKWDQIDGKSEVDKELDALLNF